MAPRYGRAYGSEPAVSYAPYNKGNKITMIGAISITRVEAAMYGEWSANGEIFLHFLEHYLCPNLKPHHVVVMDNVGFHKISGVKNLIDKTGAKLVYQPPYSPELNPIEEMWSKIKGSLRD
jgi:transposase